MTIGIYCIQNLVDGKRYIGKSRSIEQRISAHKRSLKKERHKDVNRYLHSAAQKHELKNFVFFVLEEHVTLDEVFLADRELHFMDLYNTCDREHGYNLRRDSSTKTTMHPETCKLISENNKGEKNPNFGNRWTEDKKLAMSINAKQRHAFGASGAYGEEWKTKISEASTNMWKDTNKKEAMKRKVASVTSTLRFYEYDKKTKEFIKVWESMDEIRLAHPDYHRIAIYSVCNGHKKSYRGSVWVSELKQTKEPNDSLSRHRDEFETQHDLVVCNEERAGNTSLEKCGGSAGLSKQ
jgi:group I intron endonuclease